MGLTIFLLSFAVSGIFYFKFPFRKLFFVVVIFSALILNFNYAVPWDRSYEVRDSDKLSGLAFDLQRRSAILDYLPKTAPIAPKEAAFETPKILNGNGVISNYKTTSSTFSFDAEIYKDSEVQIPVMDFPNWVVLSGNKIIANTAEGKYGLITIKLLEGKHIIQGRFMDTPIRTYANIITVFSLMILLSLYIYESNNKKNKKA